MRTGVLRTDAPIACGAVSGFHALISSGTTPKLLDREESIRSVAYGAMITEMLVALMALVAGWPLAGSVVAIRIRAGYEAPVAGLVQRLSTSQVNGLRSVRPLASIQVSVEAGSAEPSRNRRR